MIAGTVTDEGEPVIRLNAGGRVWTALIDTGFNGDLELPEGLRQSVNPRFLLRERSLLAGGQSIDEDIFEVDFPFDGAVVTAEAAFAPSDTILVGTHLLRGYSLLVNFFARTVMLERVA